MTAVARSRIERDADAVEEFRLLLLDVAGFTVAVDSSDLAGFDRQPLTADGRKVPAIDLARWFGSAFDERGSRRIRVDARLGEIDVEVGPQLRMQTVGLRQLHRLPDFLAGLTATHGVTGLVEVDGAFAFLIDLNTVVTRWAEGEGADR